MTQVATRQSLLDGVSRVLINENEQLAALGKTTSEVVLGEPASSASVVITDALDGKAAYPVTIINTGKMNMYDVILSVQELIEGNDSAESIIRKTQEMADYRLAIINPGRVGYPQGARVPYRPPYGPGFAFTVISRGGGSEQDVYRRDGVGRLTHERYQNQKLVFSKTY